MVGSLQFLSDIPVFGGFSLAFLLGGLAWWLYRRETQGSVTKPLDWILPSLRAVAVALIVLTLLEPIIESEQREGQPGKVILAIDTSESMSLIEGDRPYALGRLQRAEKSLGGEAGLIAALQDRFDVSVQSIGDDGELRFLWDSSEEREWQQDLEAPTGENPVLPESSALVSDTSLSTSTAIGNALQNIGKSEVGSDNNKVVVLLTDGQNNTGASPIATAEDLPEGVSVFSLGFGPAEETPDLHVAEVQTATRIFSEGNLFGTATIAERIPKGRSYSVQVDYSGEVVWEQSISSKAKSARKVAFSFPVQKLLDIAKTANASVEYAALPVKLEVRVKSLDDRIESNNTRAAYTSVITQRAKLLLVDGRSRWETRYIKNMFTRDASWELKSVILKPDYSLLGDDALTTEGNERSVASAATNELPLTKADLFEYDLVFLGDVPPGRLPAEFLEHLAEFVSIRGSGLICIDGVRGNLKDEGYEALREVFPVRWNESMLEGKWNVEPTELGEQLAALQLDEDSAASSSFWQELPEVDFLAAVEPQLGAEVLLEAKRGNTTHPLMVTRRSGAGRVLYFATDETWRWRFEEADKVHTRIWNQWVRWTMSQPYSQSNDYIALDTGDPSYAVGESVEIRCRLRDDSGMPRSGQTVTAVVEDSSGKQRRFVLGEHSEVEGSYRALAGDLPAGDYRVRLEAAGFPAEALRLESEFGVLQPVSLEMSATTCNVGLLQEIAERSGGEYFGEGEMEELIQAIRPRSGGKILLSTMILWQSYWWFCAAILLLVVEWGLRKRAGLI